MMDAFRRSSGGVRTNFDAPEASLLRSLIEQVMSLLDEAEDDRTDPAFEPDAATTGQVSPGRDPGPGHPDEISDASIADVPGAAELDAMLGFSPRTRPRSIRPWPGCCPTPTATTRTRRGSSAATPSSPCARPSRRSRRPCWTPCPRTAAR